MTTLARPAAVALFVLPLAHAVACSGDNRGPTAAPRHPLPASSFLSPPSSSAMRETRAASSLPAMSEHFGPRICGRWSPLATYPDAARVVAEGGDACFARAGCPRPEPWTIPTVLPCPPVPMLTVARLVHGEGATGDTVVVRGRLTFANGVHLMGHERGPDCGETGFLLAVEALVDEHCFAVDLLDPRCHGDASRVCCDHLPIGSEVGLLGKLVRGADPKIFNVAVGDSRLCAIAEVGEGGGR